MQLKCLRFVGRTTSVPGRPRLQQPVTDECGTSPARRPGGNVDSPLSAEELRKDLRLAAGHRGGIDIVVAVARCAVGKSCPVGTPAAPVRWSAPGDKTRTSSAARKHVDASNGLPFRCRLFRACSQAAVRPPCMALLCVNHKLHHTIGRVFLSRSTRYRR